MMEEKLLSEDDAKEESSEIRFVNQEGSSDIKFTLSENYRINGNDFTKMTAKFRMGQRYGNETFHATYWKPGTELNLKPSSISALVFMSHGYAEYLGDDYE